MRLEITANKLSNISKPRERFEVLVKLDGDWFDLSQEGFQTSYQGKLYGKDAEQSMASFLIGLEQRCDLNSKVVVADETTMVYACEAEPNDDLKRQLGQLEERYFLVTRNEWVSWPEFHDFYVMNEETHCKPGTPVERLRQAAFDTRRTGKAFFNLGELKGWQPDVEFMLNAVSEDEKESIEYRLNHFALEVHKYESNDGIINPKLTPEKAEEVAKLFELMANVVQPYWNRVKDDYKRQQR